MKASSGANQTVASIATEISRPGQRATISGFYVGAWSPRGIDRKNEAYTAKFQKGNPGRPKGALNKPKPLAQRLSEIFGATVKDKDLVGLVERALVHALGDTIVTENLDGQKLTAKCVSDPRLLGLISKTITDHEAKKPNFIAVPVSPEFYAETMKMAEAVEQDVDTEAKP